MVYVQIRLEPQFHFAKIHGFKYTFFTSFCHFSKSMCHFPKSNCHFSKSNCHFLISNCHFSKSNCRFSKSNCQTNKNMSKINKNILIDHFSLNNEKKCVFLKIENYNNNYLIKFQIFKNWNKTLKSMWIMHISANFTIF